MPAAKWKDWKVKCNACIKITRSSEVKVKCVEYLGGKCLDCNEKFHPVCFDFDHKNKADKDFKISGHYIYRWKELKKELDKCELRCSNCHRLKHWREENP